MISKIFHRLRPQLGGRGLTLLAAAAAYMSGWTSFSTLAAAAPESIELPAGSPTLHQESTPPEWELPDADNHLRSTLPEMTDSDDLLLPDLRTLPPYDLQIEILPGGIRELRLSNTIWNSGLGALELEGEIEPAARKTRVTQNILSQSGASLEYLVGEFIWHSSHDHWHFGGFSIYELWSLTPDGGLEAVIRSSDKISYCLIDTDVIDRQNEAFSPRRRYYGCGRTLQGLSAGWGDTYKSHLDGQSISLLGVEDGRYALKSIANPDGILLETNANNNAALHFLEISGKQVNLIDSRIFIRLFCQKTEPEVVEKNLCKL
jgi:hypothetical protein